MKYYSEVSNIVKGAISGDKQLVVSYTQLLTEKLRTDGEVLAAKGLSEQLSGKGIEKVNTQNVFARPVPVEMDNRFALADKTFPELSESVIYLTEHDEDIIESFVSYILKREKLEILGIPINSTLLLHGQPGTGKSKLAAHIAARLELPLLTARADALISSYLGSTSKNIRSLLEYARAEPCVLFLDEFDSIAKARDDKNEIGELKRVVVSLLQNIDNLGETILVAATNHAHLLDPAIGRRFHHKMELLPPRSRERTRMFTGLLSDFSFTDSDYECFVINSAGMTGAEIEMATYDYLRHAIINDEEPNTIGLLRKLLLLRFPWLNFLDEERYENMSKLKSLDPNFYTGKLLSQLWDISPSYVSRIFREHSQ